MKYIRVMMLALLTLCGNRVVGQTFEAYPGATEVIHKYVSYDNLVCDLTGEMDEILAKLGYSQPSDMDNNGGYIRWSAINAEGVNASNLGTNVYEAPSGIITLFYGGSAEWWSATYTKMTSDAYYWYNGLHSASFFQENGSKYLNVSLNLAWGETMQSTFPGYSISCYIANEPFNTSANTEPQIDIQYVFHFNETGASPFENVPTGVSSTALPSYTYSALTAQPTINVDLSAQQSGGVNYVRWYLTKDGSEVSTDGWTLSTDGVTYQTYQNSRYFYTATASTDLLKLTVTPPSGVELADYQLVCLVSDNDDAKAVATDGTLDTDGEALTTEPTIDAQYVVSFEEIPFENVASISETKEQSENIYEALFPASASITLNDATAPSYIRWYFADANGNAVPNPGFTLSNEGYTYPSQGNSIYYGGTSADAVDALLNMTVTPQDGMSWSDLTSYKLVALLSNEVGTTDENGTLTQEPLIATKYEISFDYVTFASALPSNQHTLDIEVADANAQTATISLSEQWEQIKSDLGAETVTYMKYYWLDASDNVVSTGLLSGNDVSFTDHTLAGMHWLKSGDFSTDMLDFTASVTSGVITDYKLVILLSDEAVTYDENSTWVKEPTLQSMYTVSFYAPRTDFDGSLVSGGISKAVEVTYEYGATTVQVGDANDATDTYSLVYDWGQNTNSIQSLFNYITQSGDNWSTNVYYPNYRRAYVRNKETKELLANQNEWLTWTKTEFDYDALFYNEQGEFWTKNYAQYRQGSSENNWEWAWFNGSPYTSLLAVTVNLPEGTDLTFEDIEVVIILAKKDAERETHSADDHTVDLGPDGYEVEYVYSFKEEGVTFENTVSATEYKAINIYDELTYENIPVDLGGEAPTYVRWYWSWDGSTVATTEWTFANADVAFTDYNGTKYCYAGTTANEELNQLTITPPTGTDAKTLPSTNLKLVALVSTKTADDGAIQDASSNLIKEPLIDKKYIISFASVPFEKSNSIYNATQKEDNIYVTDEQKNGTASVTVELDDNLPTILSTFYKSSATDLDAGFYLRWYIADGNGNRVTNLTGWSLSSANGGVTYTVNDYGHYWYSALNTSIKVSENTDLMNLVVQCPSGTDLTQYKAVCVMSANLSDAVVIDNQLVSEPTWTLQYTYSFASLTFEGSTAGAQSLSETIRLADDAMSSVTLSLPLSSVQDYMGNEASSFYIRYYLTDKSGNRVALPTGVTITPTDNSITLTSNDYGHYWYSSTGIGNVTDWGVTVADVNGTTDLRNYNVVAVMSSNAPLQVEADGTVTYEPREMEVVYTYELKKPVDNSFDGACTGVTKSILVDISNIQNSTVTLTDLYTDYGKDGNEGALRELFSESPEYPIYRRFYIRNKKTKELLNNQSQWLQAYVASGWTDASVYYTSENGHFWTAYYIVNTINKDWILANFNSYACEGFLQINVVIPSGYTTEDLINYEVVGVLSSGEETWVDGVLTKGPEEHEVEYIFRFTDGIDRFSGTAATDAIEKSFRRELEEDENGVYDKTAQLDLSEDMSAEYKTKLSEAETVYLRWYVTDKSGNILSPDASPVSLALPENDKLHQTEYGYIWHSGYDGEGTFSTDLLNVTAIASASVNLYDYNVVCVMTTDVSGATMEGGEFVKESTWEARYTYTFTRAFAGELADDAKTIYKTLVVADDATSVNVPLSKRIGEIAAFFGCSITDLNTNFHIRWALLNNEGDEVYTQGQLVNTDYYENDYGIYWNTKANKNSKTFQDYGLPDWFDATYTLLDGAAWNDYKIVVYMTDDNDDEDGVRTETYSENSTEKTRLIHEPNYLELRYIIDFQTVSEVQSRFVHYKGYTNSDFTSVEGSPTTNNMAFNAQTGEYETVTEDIRQQTHEWTYEIYIKPGETKNLVLPIQNDNSMEPQAYFRWYDWNTDMNSNYLNGNSGTLLEKRYGTGEANRGLFATCLSSNASNASIGATFTAPSDDWNEPIVIACDISKYGDGMDLSGAYLIHEPTLSYRYKYVIRPASMIADAIKAGVDAPNDNLLENHGDVTIGILNSSSAAYLRLNLSNVDNYYFYPYTLTHNQETGERIESWGSDMIKATKIKWRVYDASGLYYMDMGDDKVVKDGLFFILSQTNVNGIYYNKYNPNDNNQNKNIQFNIGDPFYVFAYASDGTNSCPIARFNCRFSENYPIAADELMENSTYRTRTVNYLDQHYSRVGLISFDVEEGGTLDTPTFPLDNMNPMPFKWSRSHYGYCYPGLYHDLVGSAKTYYGLSPLHGDYTLIKSMNLDDVSENGSSDGYQKSWWNPTLLRDQTYRYSNGSQSGYFLYVDASDESRPIANVAFEGEMCIGSTLVLSAMVADMTSGSEKPQLIFKLYGIKTDVDGNETERKLVHSFATCSFGTVGASQAGTWYQVYAKVTLQNNSEADQYRQFIVSIDNYCAHTNGADYAIDDIRIYAQNSKVEVKQTSVLCSGNGELMTADIMIPHETLLAMMPTGDATKFPLPVYYRICTEDGTPVTGTDFYGTGMDDCGQVDFRYYFYDAASSDENEKAIGEGETAEWLAHHYRKDAQGNRYFVVNEADQKFALTTGKRYYVSLAIPKSGIPVDGEYEVDEYTWGNPQDPCSMYSEAFQPLSQSLNLMVGSNGINRINVDCHLTQTTEDFAITGALQLPNAETGELVSIDNPALCSFDWIVENVDDATIFTDELRSALVSFRGEYKELQDADGNLQYTAEGNIIYHTALPETRPADDAEDFNGKEYDLLKAAIDAGKLYIVGSSTLKGPVYKVGNTYRIISIPLEEEITYHGVKYSVCPEPMEVTVEARLNGPELDLGFKEVDYEGVGLTYGAEGLRVGLKQLEKMQNESVPLHLPISKYKELREVDGEHVYVVNEEFDLILDEFDVIVWDSNDPTWAPYLCKEKNLYDSETEVFCIGGEKSHEISYRNQSVELLLHPKFTRKRLVTKQETVDGTSYEWHEVEHTETSAEIKYHEGYWYKVKFRYSTREDAEDNPILGRCYGESYITIKVVPEYATWGEGLPNNSNWLNDENWRRSSKAELYKEVVNSNNYPVYDESTGLSNDKGFVPMSFTYVTILGGMPTPYPYLSQLQTNKFTGLITEETLTNGDLSPATNLIQYDMMVTAETMTCPNDASKTNVYECERFYGNICNDIYFKPRAQLRNQHYLTYTKAWVDVELLPGQWTMLAAPLMKVHAGDFYVPTVEGESYGQQKTEAFLPITFDAALNSRNAYPFYQRSWDKKESKVVTTPDDIRGESETDGEHWYDAFVSYTPWAKDNVNVECLQWSHVYNDMQEHYEPGRGFSIKAHHKADVPTPLIRLPKADVSYTYYDYDDKAGHTVSMDITQQHRLAVDGVATGMLAVPLASNETEANGYYLVGNPYMARLDMELFFSYNPQLVKTYWVVAGDEVKYRPTEDVSSLGIIGPMQSFFVKVAEGKSVSQVVFSPAMQASNMRQDVVAATDESVTTRLTFATRTTFNVPTASSTRVILSAEADNGFVEEEDVETLLDSNLGDVPMVYTVAGTQTAVVNRLSDLTLLPLGIFGKEGTTETVTVNGVDKFDGTLYLYDAVTRGQTLLEEGTGVSLNVGEHGRYFITTRALENNAEETAWQVRCYALQGRLIVAAMPQDCITRITVYDMEGRLVADEAGRLGEVAGLPLAKGIYAVKVATGRIPQPQTAKVAVND